MNAIKLSDFLATYGAVSIYIVAPGQSNIVQYDLADFEGEDFATAYELLTAQLTPQALAAVGETTTEGVEAGQIEWRAAPDQYLGVNHKMIVINRLVVWGTLPTTDGTPATEATPEVIANDADADADTFEPIGRATYSVEDNKLRLYPDARLDTPTYERVKAAGFKWAPKQELFVAPMWTPQREDLLLELCGEVEDEDYSATERAADRAERFEGYREKRTAEAVGHADTFDAGPRAFGHQSAARASRQARRHDRHRRNACSQWAKAEYWQARTEGVIANALHKADPATRRGRIKTLETEQRKHEKERQEYAARFAEWEKVLTLDGADQPLEMEVYQPWANKPEVTSVRPTLSTPAAKLAYTLVNFGNCYGEYEHPRKVRPKSSLYTLLTLSEDPITPAEAATLWLRGRTEAYTPGCYSDRWSDHYANRLTYERAMLANEGGAASDVEMIPGGFIRVRLRSGEVKEYQIHAVNKSNATGKVVSVKVWDENRKTYKLGNQVASPGLTQINIERAGEDCYRAPTAEELEAFTAAKKEAKAAAKASKPKEPSLINPTDEDAERLQAFWNADGERRHNEYYARRDGRVLIQFKPSAIIRMTQKQYSELSKGSYSSYETSSVCEHGLQPKRYGQTTDTTPIALKVRTRSSGECNGFTPRRVVVITDKPQKALPLDWDVIEGKKAPTPPAVVEVEEPTPAIVDGEALLFA